MMAAKGYTQGAAEAWIARKIGQASAPVKNETAYLRACLAQEAAPAPAPGAKAPAKKTAKKGKPATTAKAAPARVAKPYWRVRNHQVAEAVTASRGGEPHDQLAERLNVTTLAVDQCRAERDCVEGFAAVLAGEAPEEVAARFPRGHSAAQLLVEVQRYRDRERRRRAVAALRRGQSPQEVAEQSGADVDTVLTWRREADRRRRAGLAA
ncbi:hypothetical protein [Pseudonocardia sp.]|uniref:hypothetical protein n=1 Tax=Pseudonocardia sp. TaxID=60912 RepID=UPI00262FA222|nr:hypothetical protein [Pseudonocardia sp.]